MSSARRVVVLVLAITLSALGQAALLVSPDTGQVGRDFKLIVWAPIRGLMNGLNPYAFDPTYLQTFGVDLPASFHAPGLLVLLAPLGLVNESTGLALSWVAALAACWYAAMLVIPPSSRRNLVGCVLLGVVLTLSWPATYGLQLAQVAWVPLVGLALVLRHRGKGSMSVGVALLTVYPTFAVPFSLLLAGAGRVRPVLRGWVIAVAVSIPVVVLAAHAAGGMGALASSIISGLRDPRAFALPYRVDAIGRVLSGSLTLTIVSLAVTVAAALLARRYRVPITPTTQLWAVTWCLLLFYAQPYNLVLLLLAAANVLWTSTHWRVLEWCLAATLGLSLLSSELIDITVIRNLPVYLFPYKADAALICLVTILSVTTIRILKATRMTASVEAPALAAAS